MVSNWCGVKKRERGPCNFFRLQVLFYRRFVSAYFPVLRFHSSYFTLPDECDEYRNGINTRIRYESIKPRSFDQNERERKRKRGGEGDVVNGTDYFSLSHR